ncbi:MAG: UDP binding domain-containing protein, partial [Pontimonas sp.]
GVGNAVAFLGDVDEINMRRRTRVLDVLFEELGDLSQVTIALWGLAFKPDSDDIRDSPALDIAENLARAGAHVRAFDPEAMGPAALRLERSGLDDHITLVDSPGDALQGSNALVVATEWKTFREFDPATASASVVVDGRNCLDRPTWKAAGWRYRGMGRT